MHINDKESDDVIDIFELEKQMKYEMGNFFEGENK